MPKAKALILDSDEATTEILQELLSQKLESHGAKDAKEALERCLEHEYDLIFTEIDNNGKSGVSVIEELKRKQPNALIIAMSYKPTVEQAISAIRQGAMDFLAKPFSVEDVALVMEKYFSMTTSSLAEFNLIENLAEEKRTFVLPTDFLILNPFLNEVLNMLKRFPGVDKRTLLSLRLCLYEMLVNSMEHGNLEIDYQTKKEILEKTLDYHKFLQERAQMPPYRDRKIVFSYQYANDKLTFTITDEGPGFDVSKIPSPLDEKNLESLSGRGIFITRINMDEVYYNEKGNSVTLTKKLSYSK
ncbi:MAG: ATP-binding protein [Leptospiraceae bacterium]|nr:ATP-binding protein [Leptospiraceae bacterium]MDW8305734.1 ATP-binding protein [Leptospiraceae bacterium]